MSHDTDFIIQNDENKRDKKKKRKRKNKKKDDEEHPDQPPDTCESPQGKRTHLENMELDLQDHSVPVQEPTLSVQQETVDEEPADSTNASEPAKITKNGNEESPQGSSMDPDRPKEKKVEGGTHRAGFDAFMTGYIFAFARNMTAMTEESKSSMTEESKSADHVPECLNKLYLSGKSVPLHIAKSTFTKSSKAHVHKMDFIWGKSPAVQTEGSA